ncbi:hypothetical protein N431DRAFT_459330 [Stipitochalara longipes BDJ]|nr:hypothetical protein N431DRAFT_459330 [Stipitochalara longipes BDJ]
MWQYNAQNPNRPVWKPETELNLNFSHFRDLEPKTGAPTKGPGDMLDDVERALNYIKTTLGELDRALNDVEQRLSQALHIPAARSTIKYILVKEELEDEGRLYDAEIDPALLEDGLDTGNTLRWYLDQDNKVLGTTRDLRALRQEPKTGEKDLSKDSDSDLVGYAADDERSSPFGKRFNP